MRKQVFIAAIAVMLGIPAGIGGAMAAETGDKDDAGQLGLRAANTCSGVR
jgi:hypothetical protein